MKKWLTLFCAGLVRVCGATQPNMVVIMVDDLGWADVAGQNEAISSIFETPNIDRIFGEGFRFSNGYVANAT